MTERAPLYPPIYFLIALVLMLALHLALPLAKPLRAPYTWAGFLLIALGIGLAVSAGRLFGRARTTIKPFERSSALVIAGPYRFTRNPMYLGMVVGMLGLAILLGSLTPPLVIPPFVALIQQRFIRAEEADLQAAFGPRYEEYRRRVRRWI
jgi:protein-S-isoprenylcysteine O-methyltransferase Ste14